MHYKLKAESITGDVDMDTWVVKVVCRWDKMTLANREKERLRLLEDKQLK